MEFTNIIADDDAVSPVIGVILMVAITVILAAVIGTFVLGLGDQVSDTSPQASFTFDFDSSASVGTGTELANGTADSDDGDLTITHDGGDSIKTTQLFLKDNEGTSLQGGSGNDFLTGTSEATAGTSVTVAVDGGDTVRVVWESENGGDTATLGKWNGPGA